MLCVGLDPDPERLPSHLTGAHDLTGAVLAFNWQIIEQTRGAACAYKLNLAFYEALGADGWSVIERTLEHIPSDAVTIADGKRGDIGNSARFYARATFDRLGFDACTVSGYMGRDSIEPFLEYEDRGAFLLIRTSNPGARDLQEGMVDGEPLYLRLARMAAAWNEGQPGTLGFVVGATDVDSLARTRRTLPEIPLLIPGVGVQGGDISRMMEAIGPGGAPILINSSRSIIYASDGRDFAEVAGQAAEALRAQLEAARARD